jgi:hypothetical protein
MSFINGIDTPVSRRRLLVGAGLASTLGAADIAPAFGAATAPTTAPARLPGADDPEQCLRNYIRLTSDLSGRPVYGWQQGMLYGYMPGRIPLPLLGIVGFGCGSIERQLDGSYHSLWKEVLYFTDRRTGEVVNTWLNPYTGETCEVMHVHNRSVNAVLTAHVADADALKQKFGFEMGYASAETADLPNHPFYMQTAVVGDTVTLYSDARFYRRNPLDPKIWPRESSGDHISIAELYTNTGSLAPLLDVTVANVPSTGSWNRICPWLPWMLMGGQPGELIYRSATKKLNAPSELPPGLRAYTERHYPEFLTPPNDFNLPPESSLEVFMRERKPSPPR